MKRFLLVGLTGGIATGKSTVSAMFSHLGARIVDADLRGRNARQGLLPEPGEEALDGVPRRHHLAAGRGQRLRLRQRLPVHLAVRRKRQGVEDDESRRHHVLGQLGSKPRAELLNQSDFR